MLYKFRTLDNFQFILDIIVNQRLYAASFDSMNDPMEGFYTSDDTIPDDAILALQDHRKSLKFSSLSKYSTNPLMWAHYANGTRGITIGIEAKDTFTIHEMTYGSHSHLSSETPSTLEMAKNVLTYKADFWRYEDEVRIFAKNGNYIPITIKEIIFGEKVDKTQKALIKKIIKAVNPNIKLIDWDENMFYVHSDPVFNTCNEN